MTLDRLIGRIALIGGLSLFGYNCDSSSDPASCIKDTDCKGERLCEKNVCVDKTATKYSCDKACDQFSICEQGGWGTYNTKSACLKDCENEPWSEKFKYCKSISNCDTQKYQSCKKDFK